MQGELEAAVADGLAKSPGGHKAHAPPPGTPCANCGAPLAGLYCHDCGQSSDNHKRSLPHLVWEIIEDLFHLDGRLLRTVPDLFLRPGRLARDYMEGRVARHVPPFRAFLVTLLLYMFAAEHAIHQAQAQTEKQEAAHAARLLTPEGRAAEAASVRKEAVQDRDEALKEAAADRKEALAEKDGDPAEAQKVFDKTVAAAQAAYAQSMDRAAKLESGQIEAVGSQITLSDAKIDAAFKVGDRTSKAGWLKSGIKKAISNPEYFLTVMFGWGHRLAVLLLPIVGLTLAAVYRNKPQYYIHDHMLVAMDLLSFAFLINALGLVLPEPYMGWWLGFAALWTPVNLFQTLRGGYGSGLVGAALKTLMVWLVTVLSFGVLLLILVLVTLSQL